MRLWQRATRSDWQVVRARRARWAFGPSAKWLQSAVRMNNPFIIVSLERAFRVRLLPEDLTLILMVNRFQFEALHFN